MSATVSLSLLARRLRQGWNMIAELDHTNRLLKNACVAFSGGAAVSAFLAGLSLSPLIATAGPPRSEAASTAVFQPPAEGEAKGLLICRVREEDPPSALR